MLGYGGALSGRVPSCSRAAFLRLASKKGKSSLVRNDDKQSHDKTDRRKSERGGETLNATVVSCSVVLANANVRTRGSKHGGATC